MLIGKRIYNKLTGNVYEIIAYGNKNVTLKGIGKTKVTFTMPEWMLENYSEKVGKEVKKNEAVN